MPRGIAARRHAQAVFQIALEKDELEKWRADLKAVAAIMSDRQVRALLQSPRVHLSEKLQLVSEILPAASELALNLAYLLIARGRLAIVEQITAEYERLVDAYRGVEHAEVTTAIPLDQEARESLTRHLASITRKEVALVSQVDPDVIGGLVVRIGDRLIDGSTKSRLKVLRDTLVKVR